LKSRQLSNPVDSGWFAVRTRPSCRVGNFRSGKHSALMISA
jgi:hypothetical protein